VIRNGWSAIFPSFARDNKLSSQEYTGEIPRKSQKTGGRAFGPLTGVAVSEIYEDSRDPEMRYIPGHPDTNADGYVAFPRINPAEDMVDLMGASRGYQANVAAMTAVKEVINHSLDLMR
jgi:flagellar basal-body rod protein FlgC